MMITHPLFHWSTDPMHLRAAPPSYRKLKNLCMNVPPSRLVIELSLDEYINGLVWLKLFFPDLMQSDLHLISVGLEIISNWQMQLAGH